MTDEKKYVITDIFGLGKLGSYLLATDLHVLIVIIGLCVFFGRC